ncbi:MAG: hypothetical protein HUJ26_08165 [Planctomycetaceae bacterium]|nr:hypothetical protein [Planctomycetaceae bacterium]
MTDLTDLSSVSGDELTESQIKGILAQIDLDITNLVRDGKLSALNYAVGGQAGRTADRAGNLRALLDARTHYQQLLESAPSWNVNQFEGQKSQRQDLSS